MLLYCLLRLHVTAINYKQPLLHLCLWHSQRRLEWVSFPTSPPHHPLLLFWLHSCKLFWASSCVIYFKQWDYKIIVVFHRLMFILAIICKFHSFKGLPRGPRLAEIPDYKWHLSGFFRISLLTIIPNQRLFISRMKTVAPDKSQSHYGRYEGNFLQGKWSPRVSEGQHQGRNPLPKISNTEITDAKPFDTVGEWYFLPVAAMSLLPQTFPFVTFDTQTCPLRFDGHISHPLLQRTPTCITSVSLNPRRSLVP